MKTEEDIKTYRIGNEIQIKWPILTNGEEQSLAGRRLSLYLSDQWGNDRKVETFGTEGNVIVFTFLATEQYKTGVYRLTLFENEGIAHQTACDYCFAFRLVAHSCDIPVDMEVKELPLSSTNMSVGIHGLSAYELAVNYGYEGSEEQWMKEFQTVLSSTQLIVESVERAGDILQRTEELMEEVRPISEQEHERIESEQQRVESERERNSGEQNREQQEAERIANENARKESELQRQDAFGNSENSRTSQFEQREHERAESFSQSEQQRQQTFMLSEEEREKSFAESENGRQATFEESESQRESRVNEVLSDIDNAESERSETESQRKENEQERQQSESSRRLNENTRQENENIRGRNESTRRSNENLRVQHEQERVENELQRQRNEDLRIQQDDVIAEAERLRSQAETRRVSSENERAVAEQRRNQAETLRENAELDREKNTKEAIDGIEAKIKEKHETYQQTLDETVSEAERRVQTAINDWNRTRRVFQTESEVEIQPNVKNIWPGKMPQLTIAFAEGVSGYDNEYMIEFTCPDDAATELTLPSGVLWVDDETLELQAGYTYQISIIDNLAIYAGWETTSAN